MFGYYDAGAQQPRLLLWHTGLCSQTSDDVYCLMDPFIPGKRAGPRGSHNPHDAMPLIRRALTPFFPRPSAAAQEKGDVGGQTVEGDATSGEEEDPYLTADNDNDGDADEADGAGAAEVVHPHPDSPTPAKGQLGSRSSPLREVQHPHLQLCTSLSSCWCTLTRCRPGLTSQFIFILLQEEVPAASWRIHNRTFCSWAVLKNENRTPLPTGVHPPRVQPERADWYREGMEYSVYNRNLAPSNDDVDWLHVFQKKEHIHRLPPELRQKSPSFLSKRCKGRHAEAGAGQPAQGRAPVLHAQGRQTRTPPTATPHADGG